MVYYNICITMYTAERAEVVVGWVKEAVKVVVGCGLWPVMQPSRVWCKRAEVVVGIHKPEHNCSRATQD